MHRRNNHKFGFTLVEIIVVLVILAVLSALVIPAMVKWIDKAQKQQAYVELHACAAAARSAYAETYGKYPDIKKNTELIYDSDSIDSGANGYFKSSFKDYLKNDKILGNVQMVMITGEMLSITYLKNGIYCTYAESPDGITIKTW